MRVTGERRRFDWADESAREAGLDAAHEEVQANRLVVLPTDTVYGVAADAFEAAAVRRLLRAKGRGRNMPPPVLVAAATTLDSLTTGLPAYAREMIDELWPGPLTLVCTQQPSLKWDLGDNRSTVAVRMPDHPVAIALLERTGPLAVSSANRTGMPAARTVEEAEEMLGDRVKVYLDAGPSGSDVASTILDVTGPRPRVLRRGAVPLSRLREFDKRVYNAVSDLDDDDEADADGPDAKGHDDDNSGGREGDGEGDHEGDGEVDGDTDGDTDGEVGGDTDGEGDGEVGGDTDGEGDGEVGGDTDGEGDGDVGGDTDGAGDGWQDGDDRDGDAR